MSTIFLNEFKKLAIVISALLVVINVQAQEFASSGDVEIDAIRKSISTTPTTPESYRERSVLMYMWIASMQQLGVDLRTFFDIDTEYYALEGQIIRGKGEKKNVAISDMCKLLDKGFSKLEEIHSMFIKNGPMYKPFESDGKGFPKGGDMEADWPLFQANIHNNGRTAAPGPKYGKTAWKFPIGLGWYSRPVVEDGRVYIASPGMHATSFCLDLNTGKEIWKSTQEHPYFGIYKYPAIMSTPLIQDDKIILREVNSHGGNKGQAKNLVYVDKKTGKTLSRKYAGHVDYRTQNAPVATNGKYVVYPFGVADIYNYPPVCQNFNRLVCKDKDNNRKIWDFNVGDIDALAEPVLSEHQAFQGTMEGYLYAINLNGATPDGEKADFFEGGKAERLIHWNFKADGAINTQVLLQDGKVYFGSNGGSIYCIEEKTGKKIWATKVKDVESKTRKHFTTGVSRGEHYSWGQLTNTCMPLILQQGISFGNLLQRTG